MPAKKARRKAANSPKGKSATVSIRMAADLRRNLEASAEKRGYSLNHEISVRLQHSLNVDNSTNDAFGGPELRNYAFTMAARFQSGGANAGEARFGSGTTAKQWLADSYCFDQAILAVVDALWARRPGRTPESDIQLYEQMKARTMTRWVTNGEMTLNIGKSK
jgi:hypothetical protein